MPESSAIIQHTLFDRDNGLGEEEDHDMTRVVGCKHQENGTAHTTMDQIGITTFHILLTTDSGMRKVMI